MVLGEEGHLVALLAENHPRYYEVYWAALRSGLYITGVNRHSTAEEASYIVNDSGAGVLVATRHLAQIAQEMLPLLDGCPHRLMIDGAVDGFSSYEDAVAGHPGERLAREPRGEVMLYSSGTTGRPKGVRRALSGLGVDDPAGVRTSALERRLLGMDASSVYLMPAPLYHAAALQWSAGTHELGGTVVAMERFDAEEFLRLVERYEVTHAQVVPTMMVRMLKLPPHVRARYDLSSLQCLVHAAAPCPVEVKRQMLDWLGPIVVEYYAGTEGNGLTFISAPEWLERPGSVGRAMLGTLHICDGDGAELPPGQAGTVYFERDSTPFSYHNAPEKTRDARHPARANWSTIGDMGYVDREGYLFLTDRKAFTIISGGVNIYPAEIEACLIVHPKVLDAAVFGLPDPEMGEYVHAVVQPADGVTPSPELAAELIEYTRAHLSRFKVPRAIDFRDALPRLATGKLQKGVLRDEYRAART